MTLVLDHLVVAATDLGEGVAFVERQLGVKLSPGGQHVFMGTHNALVRLGSNCYLEVIAIDPSLPAPGRPRWFGLDDEKVQAKLKHRPTLLHWVAGTPNIVEMQAKVPAIVGPIVAASRGSLSWKITIPADGSLPLHGAFPTFIEWPAGNHIASNMADQECELIGLHVQHPQAILIQNLLSMPDNKQIRFQLGASPGLTAIVKTPNGMKNIS